jgi:hypothetical protein
MRSEADMRQITYAILLYITSGADPCTHFSLLDSSFAFGGLSSPEDDVRRINEQAVPNTKETVLLALAASTDHKLEELTV